MLSDAHACINHFTESEIKHPSVCRASSFGQRTVPYHDFSIINFELINDSIKKESRKPLQPLTVSVAEPTVENRRTC